MSKDEINRRFSRRPFTRAEREKMEDLYRIANVLGSRIGELAPRCIDAELALVKLSEALNHCETAIAMSPSQPTMGDAVAAMCESGSMPKMAEKR